MPRRLTVSIRTDGSIVAEASGTPGPECLDALEQLKRILDADIIDSKPTPEFSASPHVRLTVENTSALEDRA